MATGNIKSITIDGVEFDLDSVNENPCNEKLEIECYIDPEKMNTTYLFDFEKFFLSIQDVDETLLKKDHEGLYLDLNVRAMYGSYIAGRTYITPVHDVEEFYLED